MATQIFIVSGTTQVSPADWTNANNTVEAIGAGASGGVGDVSNPRASGGGGGEYRKIINFSVIVPGTTPFVYVIGAGGAAVSRTTSGGTAGNDGSQVTFNVTDLIAKPGLAGAATTDGATTASGGLGGTGGTGAAANFNGGRGGDCTINRAVTGGGGAAGPNGAGNQGVDSVSLSVPTDGGSGDNGLGGAGGPSTGGTGDGSPGGNGAEWDATHGSGGGGSGARAASATVTAGSGGNYGAGGGGVANNTAGNATTSGAGAQGLIVITYGASVSAGWMGKPVEGSGRAWRKDLGGSFGLQSPAPINRSPQQVMPDSGRQALRQSPAWFFQPMGNVPTAATPQGWKGEWTDQRRRPLIKDLAEASEASPPLIQRRGWESPPISIRQRPLVRDLAEASDATAPALQFRAPDDRWSATPWPRMRVASGYEQSLFAITVVVTAYSWGEQPQTPITIRPSIRGPFAADVRLGTDATPTGFVGAFPDLFIRSKLPFMADGWQPMGNVPTADTPQGWWPQGWKETRVPRWIQPTQLEWFYEASAATVVTYPDGWRFDVPAIAVPRLRIGPSATVGKAADATFMAWVGGQDASRIIPRRAASAPVEPFPPTVPQGWGAWSDGSRVMIRRWAGFDAFGQPAAPTIWGWSGEFPSILIRRPRIAPQQETPRARVETVWVASFHDVKLIARTLSAQYPIDTIVAARAATLGWDWTESRVRRARKPMAEPMGIDAKPQPFAQGPMGWWTEYKWTFKHPNSQPVVNEEMWLRTGFPFFYRPTLIGIDKNAALQGADTNASLDGKKETPEVDGSLGDV